MTTHLKSLDPQLPDDVESSPSHLSQSHWLTGPSAVSRATSHETLPFAISDLHAFPPIKFSSMRKESSSSDGF
jgi:hypothetical protein